MRLWRSMFLTDVDEELRKAEAEHGAIHSHHEGYAVLLEEVEEYWDEVKKKTALRDEAALYAELVQVATVAWRIVRDLGLDQYKESPRGA